MNKDNFKKGMAIFVKSFQAKEFDYDMMWLFLKDIPDESFLVAVKEIIMTEKDINRATNIIAMIREKALTKDRPSAEEAWVEVINEVRRVGYIGRPVFTNYAIERAVECIGWRSICMSENIGFERAHFYKAYSSVSSRMKNSEITTTGGSDIRKIINNVSKCLSS